MKAPDPLSRSQDIIEQLAFFSGGQELSKRALEVSSRLKSYLKLKSASQEDGLSNLVISQLLAAESEAFDEVFDANFLAVILQLLRHLDKTDFSSVVLNKVTTHHPKGYLLDERIDAFMQVLFPNGKEDLILPPEMNVQLFRAIIWKFIEQKVKAEVQRLLGLLGLREVKDQLFVYMLQILQQIEPQHNHKSAVADCTLIQALSTFLRSYCESIARQLVQEKEGKLQRALHSAAKFSAEVISSITPEKIVLSLLSLIEALLEKPTQSNVVAEDFILDFARNRKQVEGLIRRLIPQPQVQAPLPMREGKGVREAVEFMLTEGFKGFAFEQMTSTIVDELTENDWLERFLGAWLLLFRTEKHKEWWLSFLLVD